jgi:hypothetical protein
LLWFTVARLFRQPAALALVPTRNLAIQARQADAAQDKEHIPAIDPRAARHPRRPQERRTGTRRPLASAGQRGDLGRWCAPSLAPAAMPGSAPPIGLAPSPTTSASAPAEFGAKRAAAKFDTRPAKTARRRPDRKPLR